MTSKWLGESAAEEGSLESGKTNRYSNNGDLATSLSRNGLEKPHSEHLRRKSCDDIENGDAIWPEPSPTTTVGPFGRVQECKLMGFECSHEAHDMNSSNLDMVGFRCRLLCR